MLILGSTQISVEWRLARRAFGVIMSVVRISHAQAGGSPMTASLKPEVADPGRADRSLAQALRGYFDENGFGEDGGYSSAWVDFHLGPIPMPFPNTAARKRAVP